MTGDFSITANPTSLTMSPGSSGTSQISLAGQNGFTGTVYLSAFSFPLDTSFSLTSLSLSSGTGSSTLTIAAPSSTQPGSYTVFVEAAGGCSLFHSLDVSVTVTGPDFTISVDTTQLTLAQGLSGTSTISLTSKDGFSGPLSLTAVGDPLLTTLSSQTVSLSPGTTATSTLTITADLTTEPDNYTITVYASTSSFISHYASILVTVTGPTFTLSASRESLNVEAGGSNTSIITASSVGGFSGMVSLTYTSESSGLTVNLAPQSVTVPPSGTSTLTVTAPPRTKPGYYGVDITGMSGSHTKDVFILVRVNGPDFDVSTDTFFLTLVQGDSCTSTITVTGGDGFTGTVDLTSTVSPSSPDLTGSLSPTSATVPNAPTSTLTVSALPTTTPGFYSVTVNATSNSLSRWHTATVAVQVIGPDFSLSANPTALTVAAGGPSETTTISIVPQNGFTDPVALSASSFEPQIVPTITPVSISSGSTATLTVTAAPGTLPGDFYSVLVKGTSGSLTHTIYVSITVIGPDFTVSADPSTISFNAGTPTTSTITITPANGFSDPVDLSALASSQDLNATIEPSTITGPSYAATLSLNSTIPGSYTVDVFAMSGSLFHDITIPVTVYGPDFSLSANPSTLTITAGSSKTSTITLAPTHGFNGAVDLTAPSNPSGITATFSPASITPTQTSVLTINIDPSVSPGTYTVDVHGTSGGLGRDTSLTVNVAGFSLTAAPDTLTVAEGTTQASTITVNPQNGFTDMVQFSISAPAGLTATPNPAFITGSGTSQVSITASSSISPGTYTVDVTGTAGLLTQTVTITVTVPVPNFTISPSTPTTVPCTVNTTCPTTITVNPLNGFTGVVSFTVSTPAGLSCEPVASVNNQGSTTLSCQSSSTGTYVVTVLGASGSISQTTASITYDVAPQQDFSIAAGTVTPSIILAGGSGSSTITITELGGFTGTVSFTVSTSTPAGLDCATPASAQAQTSLTCHANTAGDYTVTITGTATISGAQISHTTEPVLFHVVDFSISASPVTPSPLLAESSGTSTMTITPLNGFTGTVDFTVSSTPSGLACQTPTPASAGYYASTLSCNAASGGDYTVTVTGTSNTLHHSSDVLFHVTGFTISASTPDAMNTGHSAISTITVAAVNGFEGTVTLSDTPLPSGLTCQPLSPDTITSPAYTTSTLSCTSQTGGTYTVTITGETGPLTIHTTATFTINTPDLRITSTAPASFNTGQSANSTITISPVYGFTGTVTLTVSTSPSGIACNLDHDTIQGSGSAILTCNSSTPNDYTVKVTATGGASPHVTSMTFHVVALSQSPSEPTVLGLQPTIFYALIGVLAVAVVAGVIVAVRRRKP